MRPWREPERLGDELRRELRRHGPNAAMGDVLAAWEGAVGPEIARNAQPARFQRDGTLIVHCKDAIWGFELGHRASEIAERLPGKPALKFVPGPLPEPGPEPGPELGPELGGPRAATVEERAKAAEWAAAIEDEELCRLVARAAAASLARRPAGAPERPSG
jgi:hypothetical protein